ncbi:MAG: hypothetical protein EOP88_27525 [Verrucomicrobiaceae bacterium]|nr:MAG: hypothetical protein EOP88_27525 [Verrucomicrobiaceae bacterium]
MQKPPAPARTRDTTHRPATGYRSLALRRQARGLPPLGYLSEDSGTSSAERTVKVLGWTIASLAFLVLIIRAFVL